MPQHLQIEPSAAAAGSSSSPDMRLGARRLAQRAKRVLVAGLLIGAGLSSLLSASPAHAREISDDGPMVLTHAALFVLSVPPPIPQGALAMLPDPARVTPSSRGIPRPTPDISTPRKFIDAVASAAQDSQRQTGTPASVTIAQAILESEWGRSGLSKKAQNYFGIKFSGEAGPAGTIKMDTWEVFSGRNAVVADAFKAYNNLYESVMDHGRFLRDNPRYADAFKTNDPLEFARRIHKAGYATDPAYCSKLGDLIDNYSLRKYDVAPGAAG